MASNRIRGITIDIEGNTTKLTDSLKSVDRQLKNTQDELKDVNKLLKLDPSNVELLQQKHELLGKAVTDTKTRQEELKKALETMKNAGDTEENRKQQDALQRELIETTQKLKDLEGQYKQSSPVLASISAKTGQLAEKTKGLSTAAGIAATGMIAMATAAAKNADDLATEAKVTGFSVEELQKLKYASDLIDVSYETMTGSIQKLTKQMASGNETFGKLGVAITNADGSMRNATDVWYDAIAALGKVENATERDQLSMELFGKSAMEMAGIVDDGGATLRALGDEAEATGNILSGDAVNDTVAFNDAIDRLKATAVQSFMSAGSALATSLVPMLEKLVEWVSKVLTWFGNLDGTTQKVILTVLALVAGLSPLLSLISTITTVLPTLSAMFTALSGPVGIVIGVVAALVAIGVALYKNWDTIKAKAQELWANLTATFENIKSAIISRFTAIWQGAVNIFDKVKTAITTPIEKARDVIKGIIDKIKGFFSFNFELPKIKLPHFGITPSGWKLADLLKGSIPKLGISWYAKAMDDGVAFDRPTVIPTMDGLKGFGDGAGREIVIGQNRLMNMIQKATAASNDINVSVIVNGNVDNYDELAETIGQKLQQQMAMQGRAFA